MDAEPPRIVLEGIEPCPAPRSIRALLRRGLGLAHGPSAGWVVSLRIEPMSQTSLRAEGDITDGAGTPVARRVLSAPSSANSDCEALARAIGVWASLVLDAEVSRASAEASEQGEGASTVPARGVRQTDAGGAGAKPLATPVDARLSSAAQARPTAGDGTEGVKPRAPEREGKTIEVGAGTFLMLGPSGRPLVGASPYAVIEMSPGVFVRPALAMGHGFQPPAASEQMTWGAARVDGCLRLPGLYPPHQGLATVMCAGADVGFSHGPQQSATVSSGAMEPFVSVGPSLELDGELASHLSVVLRGVAGLNIVPAGGSGRGELALSWRLQ